MIKTLLGLGNSSAGVGHKTHNSNAPRDRKPKGEVRLDMK
jgi:hypothetical protein